MDRLSLNESVREMKIKTFYLVNYSVQNKITYAMTEKCLLNVLHSFQKHSKLYFRDLIWYNEMRVTRRSLPILFGE